jgi:hypothetical protein
MDPLVLRRQAVALRMHRVDFKGKNARKPFRIGETRGLEEWGCYGSGRSCQHAWWVRVMWLALCVECERGTYRQKDALRA